MSARPTWRETRPSSVVGGSPHLSVAIGLEQPLQAHTPVALAREALLELGEQALLESQLELELQADSRDRARHRHLRFRQVLQGLEVEGARLDLHLRDNTLTSINSSLVPLGGIRTGRRLSEADARALLEERLGIQVQDVPGQLRLHPTAHGRAEACWRFLTLGPDAPEEVVSSAHDARIVRRRSLLVDLDAVACATDSELECIADATGTGDDGRRVAFSVFRGQDFPLPLLLDGYLHPYAADEYPDLFGGGTLEDSYFVDLVGAMTRGALYVIDSDGFMSVPTDTIFFDEDDAITSGPGTVFDSRSLYGPGVSAMHSVRISLDYFQQVHGRSGLGGDPEAPVDIIARVGLKGLNAAWASEYNSMLFGTYGGMSMAVAVDVAGHELTHGVIAFSSGLGQEYEPGALNEALADMFGVLIEAYDTGWLEWRIAEDIPLLMPLRNLEHPERYQKPGHMSQYLSTEADRGGVHTNMSIPSKAFQLAIDGTPPGTPYYGYEVPPAAPERAVAAERVARVLYQCLLYRVGKATTFAEWALSLLASVDEVGLAQADADALYVSLRDAFLATGILTEPDTSALTVLGGQVVEQNTLRPVSGAMLSFTAGGSTWTDSTDKNGVYSFAIPAYSGSAKLAADAVGYYDQSLSMTAAPASSASSNQATRDIVLSKRPSPSLSISPGSASLTLPAGSTGSTTLTLRNSGAANSELGWKARPTVRYSWRTIPYVWEDLVGQGLPPLALSGDQEHSEALLLPTPFPFYFTRASSLYVSTDGYVTLQPDSTDYYREFPLPSVDAPRSLIAPWWADLNFGRASRAFFSYDRETAWIQFEAVPDYPQEQTYTFQAALHKDGRIQFQYKLISGAPDSWARVGIQDADGAQGLEVALSTPQVPAAFPTSGSALEIVPSFVPDPALVGLSSTGGTLSASATTTLQVSVGTVGVAVGSHAIYLRLESNDPAKPVVEVPIGVTVL